MMRRLPQLLCFATLMISSCSTSAVAPTVTSVLSTSPPPSPKPLPSLTPTATETPVPPTQTATPSPAPQRILLRRPCGREYAIRAGEPAEILYGGWAVRGSDLAEQWVSALTVELTVDGEPVSGQQQDPAPELPGNCESDYEDSIWLYFQAQLPELAAGSHGVTVTYNVLRALPDGYGATYGPGTLGTQTFTIIAQ